MSRLPPFDFSIVVREQAAANPAKSAKPARDGARPLATLAALAGGGTGNAVFEARPKSVPTKSTHAPLADWTSEDWRDYFEERAAIREYDGGLLRIDAEAAALADCAARWRVLNPLQASESRTCIHCGRAGSDTPVLARGGHTWLHRDCWDPMNAARDAIARQAVVALLGDIAQRTATPVLKGDTR